MGDASETIHSASFEIMDLPYEIIVMIVSWLDYESLLDAINVSRCFREIAEPFIYESVTVLDGSKARRVSTAFDLSRRRPTWVRSLLISTKFEQEHALMKLQPSLCLMTNLQDLRLETPDCNSKRPEDRVFWIALQDYYETVFRQSSFAVDSQIRLLPHLKSCMLHFVDTRTELYSLTRYSSIFLHPTLESLTISCMSTDYPEMLFKDIPNLNMFKKTTALKHLHLEECDLHPPSLEILLGFPIGLESLKISEGIRYDGIFRAGSSRMHGNMKPDLLGQALVHTCKDSLTSLSLALGYVRSRNQEITHAGQYLKLREMANLKHLEINNRTLNLIRSRPNCDHLLWQRLPPSIETLKIFSIPLLPQQHDARQPYIPLLPCLVREKVLHGTPNLNQITYSYEHYEITDDDDMNFNDLLMNLVYNEANGNPPTATADNPNPNLNPHMNPLLNLLQQAVDHTQPVAPDFVNAAMNPNLDIPPHNVQPPNYRWRTGSRSQTQLSRSDAAKLSLLQIIHQAMLDIFNETRTILQIDLVTLPRGYIPPYLFPEDKPRLHPCWFTSTKPFTPRDFVDGIRQQREEAQRRMSEQLQSRGNTASGSNSHSIPVTERERSRSRFMRRLQRETENAPASNERVDADDIDNQEGLGIDLEMENALERLIQEARVEIGVDEEDEAYEGSSVSSGGSEYVDAATEVEMSEADQDDDEDSD